MDRRTFLGTAGASGMVGLSGCLDQSFLGEDGGNESIQDGEAMAAETPIAIVESYLQWLTGCGPTGEHEFFHTEMPAGEPEFEYEIIEISVHQDSPDPAELINRLGVSEHHATTVQELIDRRETVVVEAVVEITDNHGSREETRQYATATESDGNWALLGELGTPLSGADGDTPQLTLSYLDQGSLITITHDGGDPLPAEHVRIDGDGLADTGMLPDLAVSPDYDEDAIFEEGNIIDVFVVSDYQGEVTVQINWVRDGTTTLLDEESFSSERER